MVVRRKPSVPYASGYRRRTNPLDATAGETRMSVENEWVLFSDLHVSTKSLTTTLKALEEVHEYAALREAKIAFLGDFWDIRGKLPVRPLNAIIDILHSFEQPMTMIPGNHDQVSADGLDHALSVFDSLPNIDVISEPKRDSSDHQLLWVPYRRDHREVAAAVKKHKKGLRAVFCHIDTVGGMMNNFIVSPSGMKPDGFPSGVMVYTGHYHRPHSIGTDGKVSDGDDGQIQYIGSPYQVSAHEAHQSKWLTLLDSNYDVVEKRQIDVGRRFFVIGGDGEWPEHARKGDRVTMKTEEPADTATIMHAEESGIELQVQVKPKQTQARIRNAESLTPEVLFSEFSKISKMPAGLTALGQNVLKDVQDADRI